MTTRTHIASEETLQRVADALESMAPNAVPSYDEATGRYTNASIKGWLKRQRDGLAYGVSIPKGSATSCTKTGANASITKPTPGVIGTPAVDPYVGKGAFFFVEVNGGVDADGTPYVTAIDGDANFTRANDTWIMTPVLYTSETETDDAVTLSVSDTCQAGMRMQPGGMLPDGTIRPFMLYAKYGLSVDDDGTLHTASGRQLKRFVSHDSGVTLCKTATTGYSFRNSADDWYVKAMLLLKYATKNSQSVFRGCTDYSYQLTPTLDESGTRRVVVSSTDAAKVLVGSSFALGTHTGTSTDRGTAYNYDVFAAATVTAKAAVDGSNTALYFDLDSDIEVKTSYLLSTEPWAAGSCDAVEGDGSPTSCTDGKQPFVLQGIELGYGCYEVIGNVVLYSSGSGWSVFLNNDTKAEVSGGKPDSAVEVGVFPGSTAEGWNYGLYTRTSSGLMMQQGTGASTSTGICDGNYKSADTATGYHEWLSLGYLGHGALAGLWCVNGNHGTAFAWWSIGSRLSANGRSRGESA